MLASKDINSMKNSAQNIDLQGLPRAVHWPSIVGLICRIITDEQAAEDPGQKL
jgi:hypothetical protein